MKERFRSFTGIAAPLPVDNVDTNQLCPTRFNKQPHGPAFAEILFHDQRFEPDGAEKTDFVLNQDPYRNAEVLVAGRNFGCGSSRESAVIGLAYFGIRCVIAPSFGDIFFNNCFRHGVLPVRLPASAVDELLGQLDGKRGARIGVDLERQIVTAPDGETHAFDIHPLRKRFLAEGVDEIDVTLEYRTEIESFETGRRRAMPWVRPQHPEGDIR